MARELKLTKNQLDAPFALRVEGISGENPYACYQCGKCSAGCPFADYMDALPNQVLRLVQLGDASVLKLSAPWVCASCLACTVRCPKGVDIAKTMEALRLLSLRRGITPVQVKPDRAYPQIALIGAYRKLTP